MDLYILNVGGGSFENDKGQDQEYGNVHVLDEEIVKEKKFAGQRVTKLSASPELIHHIKDAVPGKFNCITQLTSQGKIKIVGVNKGK